MMYFSDIFEVEPSVLEEYGALDISLYSDLPLFIDPFLLYASDKTEYRELHQSILNYLAFIKRNASVAQKNDGLLRHWFVFSEVKQNWLGYSKTGNAGRGLNIHFARHISTVIQQIYEELGHETKTDSSHVEELALFGCGVGKDSISDFTTNLIKGYLLEFTQTFAVAHLRENQRRNISVKRAYFNERTQRWESRTYNLPYYHGDYVLLTPKDILTKDDTWMNNSDMLDRFDDIRAALSNVELRDLIGRRYIELLAQVESRKQAEINAVKRKVFDEFPEMVEQYISMREDRKEEAKSQSLLNVQEIEDIFNAQIKEWLASSEEARVLYTMPVSTRDEVKQRLLYFKQVIEHNDGYKLFYHNGEKIAKEESAQLLFRFVWFCTELSVDREVNNGRGPVDYKVSNGNTDKTLVEFKLASNTKLEKNLANQVEVYKAANQTDSAFTVILYFSDSEQERVLKILKALQLEGNENILLIDASPKESASNVG